MNSGCFKIYALISTLLICPMWAIFQGVEFWRSVSKFTKRKRKSLSCVHVPSTWNWEVSRRIRAVMAKKCTKKRDARAKLLFVNLNLQLFCRSRCCWRRYCLGSLVFYLQCSTLAKKKKRETSTLRLTLLQLWAKLTLQQVDLIMLWTMRYISPIRLLNIDDATNFNFE